MGVKGKRVAKSLSAGRPPNFHPKPKSIKRKATKALINSLHLMEKKLLQATRKGDEAAKSVIKEEIAAMGGLERYQQASLQGQRKDRGGDSSGVLMQWIREYKSPKVDGEDSRLDLLEVGALSTENACSKSGRFDIERIDLNSQGEGIKQQDFMQRPLPKDDSERFDIISLSLVLNFVPDPTLRGDMLLRTLNFLRRPETSTVPFAPSVFLVLPAPCVTNSRYMDETTLERIMASLGYKLIHSKPTQRLVYYLWKRISGAPAKREYFTKKELRPGSTRNNFAIVLGTKG